MYIYKPNLALDNPQWLICHKNQPTIVVYSMPDPVYKSYIFTIYVYIDTHSHTHTRTYIYIYI